MTTEEDIKYVKGYIAWLRTFTYGTTMADWLSTLPEDAYESIHLANTAFCAEQGIQAWKARQEAYNRIAEGNL